MMMPKVMPTMLERVGETRSRCRTTWPEQMPDLMPKVMDNLMPHMIGDVVPLVTQPDDRLPAGAGNRQPKITVVYQFEIRIMYTGVLTG